MLASIGGQSNAYTTEDTTVFWETAPQQYLPLMLWLEADRMATLRVDQATFDRERQVVKEERRMRVENQPFGRLSELIYDQAFTVHPYKHPVIGSMEDLSAGPGPRSPAPLDSGDRRGARRRGQRSRAGAAPGHLPLGHRPRHQRPRLARGQVLHSDNVGM